MNISNKSELVTFLKALGQEDRIKIVCAIFNNSNNVSEIGQLTGVNQPSLSAHIKVLYNSGVITQQKKGKNVYYQIENPKFRELMQSISKIWCDDN